MYKVKGDRNMLKWATFVLPLRWPSWICSGFVVIASTMFYSIVAGFALEQETKKSSSHWITGLHAFFGQGQPQEPDRFSPRIAFFVLFATGMLLWYHYSATLTSFLAADIEKIPFTTLDEMLINTNYKIVAKTDYFVELLIEFFKVRTIHNPAGNKHHTLMRLFSEWNSCPERDFQVKNLHRVNV